MNMHISFSRALAVISALALGLIVFRSQADTRMASPPPEVQGESFSVGQGDPLTAKGVSPADILGTGAYPLLICEGLGLDCADTSGAMDDVMGLSYGMDFTRDDLPPIQFSVAAGSLGLAGTAVRLEADCTPAEPQADVFASALDGANAQLLDGDGIACGPNTGYSLGLTETVPSDNVDALDLDPCLNVDDNCDGFPEAAVFLTLSSDSPTLVNAGGTPADILVIGSGFAPQVWASSSSLGLGAGDVIDALCIHENGNNVYDGDDSVLFSLAAGSPTLATLPASAADLLLPAPPRPFVYATDLGLEASDDIDALLCGVVSFPAYTLYLPLALK